MKGDETTNNFKFIYRPDSLKIPKSQKFEEMAL